MTFAKVNGLQMNYVVEGEGDWLVMIGGYASGNWQAWGKQLDVLAQSFKVLAFDNRGIGESDVPDGPYTTQQMARDAAGLMDHLGIKTAHVFGKSLGGAIAQWVAIERPELVRSMAVTSTLARPSDRFSRMVQWWVATAEKAGFENLFPGLLAYFYSEAYYQANLEAIKKAEQVLIATPRSLAGFASTGNAAMTHNTWDRLGEIACPVFLLCGEDDIITTATHTREMAEKIKASTVEIVPKTLHGFMTESPESFARIVEFLKKG